MWLKKLVGVSLAITIVGMFGITIAGLGFTRSNKVLVLNPDGTTREISAAEAAANPNLVEVSSSAPGANPTNSSTSSSTGSSDSSSSASSSSNTSSPSTSGAASTGTSTSSTGTTSGSSGTSTGTSTGGTSAGGTTVSKPVVSLTISPATITSGSSSTLSWSATNSPTSCTASGSWSGTKGSSGSQSTGAKTTGSYSYSLTCSNTGGSGAATVGQTVNAPAVTYCGGLSPCYGPSQLASHNTTSSSCWGYNINRVVDNTALNNGYHKGTGSNLFSNGSTVICGNVNLASYLNGSKSISGIGSRNHGAAKSNSGTIASYFVGYYDASKP